MPQPTAVCDSSIKCPCVSWLRYDTLALHMGLKILTNPHTKTHNWKRQIYLSAVYKSISPHLIEIHCIRITESKTLILMWTIYSNYNMNTLIKLSLTLVCERATAAGRRS